MAQSLSSVAWLVACIPDAAGKPDAKAVEKRGFIDLSTPGRLRYPVGKAGRNGATWCPV
jgi:hypothetical protein